ncbi:MAG: cyanoexosortase A system-associated protein [Plectolyngbya sp. WJT66-NPBG17]|jgi:cyanosortase A-associated protein|nr:cyanoexosortase A system-associated protein [Plectolyngbya sp. WJT66-NPBG17]
MQQTFWQSARIGLFASLFLAITLTFGRTIVLTKPATARTDKSTIELPETVSLTGWQATGSKIIPNAGLKEPSSIPNRQYRYIKDGIPLEITMRYFSDSNGDVKPILQTFTPLLKSKSQLDLGIRQKDKVGFYGVFVEQQQAHLTSCINGRGDSTFTALQFQHNRNVNDLLSERPLLWLVGLSDIRDNRCLLVHLQMPLQNRSPEQAYQLLEQAWTEWHHSWQPRFQRS